MAMTSSVKDELSRLAVTKPCCRKAEVSSTLRFAGGLHLVGGRIVVEAELDTLHKHFDGMDGDELAERLIRNAPRATAGIGAASGGVSAVEWAAVPTLLSAPVLLAAETVAVVAVELKLIGELHEVYRQ